MARGSEIQNLAIVGLLGYLGYRYFQRTTGENFGRQLGQLRFQISGVHLDDQDITISLNVQNPNSQNIEIRSFVGSLLINAKPVAMISAFGDYVIRGNDEMKIQLIAKPNEMNLYKEVIHSYVKGQSRVAFQGTININNDAVPLTMQYLGK